MKIASIVCVGLAGLLGCGDDGGSAVDAAGNVPAMITVTGTASSIGLSGRMGLSGVTIAAYKEGASSPVAMTTSGADGAYSLTIETNGEALDGYLKGTIADYLETYLYPAGPLGADQPGASILMLKSGTLDTASTIAQGGQTPGMAFIGIQIYDGAMMGVGGVTISSTPAGTVRYNGSNGLPSSTESMTMADGLGYVFNVAPGTVMLSATGGGMTFKSHSVKARPDQVTTTLITP